MVRLGREIKERFSGFFSSDSKIGVYSTDYERTYRSAEIVANVLAHERAVTVKRQPRKRDPLDPWESLAEFQPAVMSFWQHDPKALAVQQKHRQLEERLLDGVLSSYFVGREFSWIDALDLVTCAKCYQDAPFAGELCQLENSVKSATSDLYTVLYSDDNINNLAVGGLLGGVGRWIERRLGTETSGTHLLELDASEDVIFVACHDVNLLPLRVSLGWRDEGFWPEYGYFVAFEFDLSSKQAVVSDSSGFTQLLALDVFLIMCTKCGSSIT